MSTAIPMISNSDNNFPNDVVDVVNCGLFQCVDGRLLTANRTGQALLKMGFLVVANGRLKCIHPQLDQRLQSFLAQPAKAQERPLILRDPRTKSEYCIRCHRKKSAAANDGKCSRCVLSVTRLRNIGPPALPQVRIFASSYGLSEAEIHVLHSVLGSMELRKLAADRGVNLDTVRKQLKSAMAKIEISSQKELFALFERFRFCDS